MQTIVALHPALGLDAAEFVERWNQSDLAAESPAAVDASPVGTFLSPEMSVALVTILAGIPAAVIADFVSAWLKDKFIDGKGKQITVRTIATPDGAPLLVVTEETTTA